MVAQFFRNTHTMTSSTFKKIQKTRHSSVTSRKFELGPQPRNWPEFLEFSATPVANHRSLLWSTVKVNRGLLLCAFVMSLLMFVGSALIPWALGIFLDSGLERGMTSALIPGGLILTSVILVRAIGSFSELVLVASWMRGDFGWRRTIIRHISTIRGGGREQIPAGEIVASVTSDTEKIGNFLYGVPAIAASAASFFVIAVMMLRTNLELGLIVVIGLPIAILAMSLLIKPLHQRLSANREERGKLTTLASDAVVGLRVLRGVGGEDTYNVRYRAQSEHVMDTGIRTAFIQAILGGLTTAVPAIFTVVVISLGLWEVYAGQLTYGELVAFFGYTVYLSVPVSSATQFLQIFTDARVGARRTSRIMDSTPLTSDNDVDPTVCEPRWESASLTDQTANITIAAGKLTVIVSAQPEISAKLAQRLARTDDQYPVLVQWEDESGHHSVHLSDIALAQVRQAVVFSGATAQLFQGRLRSNLAGSRAELPQVRSVADQMHDTGDGSGTAHREHMLHPDMPTEDVLDAALSVADAHDIVLGLTDGLDDYVAERGRSLSGGQRQRIALARALVTQAPILIAVEPTSAVDSHTEMRIASALRTQRAGRTTVIVSVSPIVLHQSDEVIVLNPDGSERMRGTYEHVAADPYVHAIVHRGQEETQEHQV